MKKIFLIFIVAFLFSCGNNLITDSSKIILDSNSVSDITYLIITTPYGDILTIKNVSDQIIETLDYSIDGISKTIDLYLNPNEDKQIYFAGDIENKIINITLDSVTFYTPWI